MSDHNRHFDSFVLDALLGAVAGVHEIIKHTATGVRRQRQSDRFFGEYDDLALIRERGTELEIELLILDRPSPARVAGAVTARLITWAADMNEADRYAYCEANALAWAAELDKLRPKAG